MTKRAGKPLEAAEDIWAKKDTERQRRNRIAYVIYLAATVIIIGALYLAFRTQDWKVLVGAMIIGLGAMAVGDSYYLP